MIEKILRSKNRKYRNALILKPGFRFNSLRNRCENLVFVTDGVTIEPNEILRQISLALEEFDPNLDCIVPVGTTISNILMGYMTAKIFPTDSITLAIYHPNYRGRINEDYIFVDVPPYVKVHPWKILERN